MVPPAYKAGGPIRSVHNLMQLLRAQTNHHLEVVCGDRDLKRFAVGGHSNRHPLQQDGVVVTYRSSTSRKWWLDKLRGTDGSPAIDVVYLNSLFSVPFALRPLMAARALGIRVVLAPRGMLGDGALAIKPLKKRVFLRVARALRWFRKVRWHASTEAECGDVLRTFPGADVVIAGNVPMSSKVCVDRQPEGEIAWLALGRIHPIKNLHFALEALQNVDLKGRGLRVDLVGPVEDEAYLQKLLGFSKSGLEVRHVGAVPPRSWASLGEVARLADAHHA